MPDTPATGPLAGSRSTPRNSGTKAKIRRAPILRLLYNRSQDQPPSGQVVATETNVAELETLADLLFAAGQGDRRAFARLYTLSAPTLFAVAMRLLRRRELAEEVVQEAYVSIWRKAGQYQLGRGQPMAWMVAVVRNRAIDRLRKQSREPDVAANLDDLAEFLPGEDRGPASPTSALGASLRECLGRLKASQQKAILLAYYHGLTHEELAARLDAPLGTVKSTVRRGLLQLKECLDQ